MSHRVSLNPNRHMPESLQLHYQPPTNAPATDLLDDEHTDKKTSDLYIKRASFTTEDVDLQASGGSRTMPKRKTFKRCTGGSACKGRLSMKRIQFIVPSRKRMQHNSRQETKKSVAVNKLDGHELQQLLQRNKLINSASNAPDELKRNIVKSVF